MNDDDTGGKTGLALSGGGYRAMLFHAGALWRLNELGWLPRIDRFSSVSGGSITAGRLAARWEHLGFVNGIATRFEQEVARPLERFARVPIDVLAAAFGLLPALGPGHVTSRFYRYFVTGNKALQDLPDAPEFYFNASHFATATNWRFTRRFMGSYRVGLVREPKVSLAWAVAASSAFPPFLSPVVLRTNPDDYVREGADLWDDVDLRRTVALTDGGVYDNLGLQPLSGSSLRGLETLLISDASGGFTVRGGSYGFWGTQALRALDTATTQARGLRRTIALTWVNDATHPERRLAMWRTLTDVASYKEPDGVPSPFPVHEGWPAHMANIRTRLNHFNREERRRLINWGYITCDVMMRNWVVREAPPPTRLPYPDFTFEAAPGETKPVAAAEGE